MNWIIGKPKSGLGFFVVELYNRGSDIIKVVFFDDRNKIVDINTGEDILGTIVQHIPLPDNKP